MSTDKAKVKLTKDQILGLVRQALTFLASFLAVKGFVAGDILAGTIPAVIGAGLILWGWLDKSSRDLSVWYSFSRHILSTLGGFVLGFGWLEEGTWNGIVSGLLGLVSIVLSMVENAKNSNK